MLMAKKNTDSGKAVYKRNVAKRVEDFRYLSHRIIEFANRGIPKVEFLHEILNILHEFSGSLIFVFCFIVTRKQYAY